MARRTRSSTRSWPSATQVGDFGTLLYAGHDWMDKKLARRSMELMAEKVMPAVNQAVAPQPAIA